VDDSVTVVRVESGLFFANADDSAVLRHASDDPSLAHVHPTVDAAVRAAKNDLAVVAR
jgi:hypothetical protein